MKPDFMGAMIEFLNIGLLSDPMPLSTSGKCAVRCSHCEPVQLLISEPEPKTKPIVQSHTYMACSICL